MFRSRPLEVILRETVLKISSVFTGEHLAEVLFQLKCYFYKAALHHLLLKPGPRPSTWTMDPVPEKLQP